MSRVLEPQLALAEEFETALASARDLFGEEQQLSERETRFQRLLEEQQQKEEEFKQQFSTGLQFDAAPASVVVATVSTSSDGVDSITQKRAQPTLASQQQFSLQQQPPPPPAPAAARFDQHVAAQQENLNTLRDSVSPVAVQAVGLPTPSPVVALTLDEIEAKQKEIQVARFEALLAEQRRKMSTAKER